MRVLFLTLYPEPGASPRYRVHQFVPYLEAHGVKCAVACPFTDTEYARLKRAAEDGRAAGYHLHEFWKRVGQIWSAGAYEVVFLQKAVMSAYVAFMPRYLRMRARRLVYDIDDAVNLEPPHALPFPWRLIEDPGQINKLFARAEVVLAGNRWLASAAEAAGGRAEVFPTVIDTERFVPASGGAEGFVVGWMGSPSTGDHLELVADILGGLSDAQVRLVGVDAERVTVADAEYHPWSLDTEVAELQQFAVGLMPLPKTEWSRGKCALKALQYMACGVPCVATPFGAVRDIIEDGVNGLFADTPDEWRDAIERLRDVELRRRLGAAARQTVEERYSLRGAAPRMLELLREAAA